MLNSDDTTTLRPAGLRHHVRAFLHQVIVQAKRNLLAVKDALESSLGAANASKEALRAGEPCTMSL